MQFLWPTLLWSLLLVPALAVAYIWALRRRKRYVLRYSSLSIVRQVIAPGSKIRRHIPAILFMIALAIMLLAAARPVAVVTLPDQQATVILTIDVSGSMRNPDIRPSRIEAAKTAAREFIQLQKPATRIGVVAFSGTAQMVQVPTTDHEAVLNAINRLYLMRSTAIGSGILVSLNAIYGNLYADTFGGDIVPTSPEAAPSPVPMGTHIPAIIILLTDGANVQGPSPLDAAEKARDLGVRVYTIGVGAPSGTGATNQPQGAPPNQGNPNNPNDPNSRAFGNRGFGGGGGGFRSELDETLLKTVAQTTEGEYFRATDSAALQEIYKGLNTEVIISTQKIEITALAAGVAAAFAIVSVFIGMLWFNRLP